MKPEPVYAERLIKLADFLDALPPERFNYAHWIGEDWGGAPDLSCGTTACAFGWATAIPEFRDLGLRAVLQNGDVRIYIEGLEVEHAHRLEDAAGEVLFGITTAEFSTLFVPDDGSAHDECCKADGCVADDEYDGRYYGPCDYASAGQVAFHIREFVKRQPVNRSAEGVGS